MSELGEKIYQASLLEASSELPELITQMNSLEDLYRADNTTTIITALIKQNHAKAITRLFFAGFNQETLAVCLLMNNRQDLFEKCFSNKPYSELLAEPMLLKSIFKGIALGSNATYNYKKMLLAIYPANKASHWSSIVQNNNWQAFSSSSLASLLENIFNSKPEIQPYQAVQTFIIERRMGDELANYSCDRLCWLAMAATGKEKPAALGLLLLYSAIYNEKIIAKKPQQLAKKLTNRFFKLKSLNKKDSKTKEQTKKAYTNNLRYIKLGFTSDDYLTLFHLPMALRRFWLTANNLEQQLEDQYQLIGDIYWQIVDYLAESKASITQLKSLRQKWPIAKEIVSSRQPRIR